MFSPTAREIFKDVLELFAQASRLPIAMYEIGPNGKMLEVARSGEEHFPLQCSEVWKLDGGRGRQLCNENMCERAGKGVEVGRQQTHLCHAGLTAISEPIIVDGKLVAVILYGAYIVENEDNPSERIARHEQLMRDLGATAEESTHIRTLLLGHTRRKKKGEWEWLHRTLPLIIGRLLDKYIKYDEREKRIQRMAYHDLQLRLQAALSLAENLRRHFKKEESPDKRTLEQIDNVAGAIEAAGTVMHNLTLGQYLPERYRFKYHTIRKFIDNALMLCRPQAHEKQIEFGFDLLPDDGRVHIQASEFHLQQAFNNVLQNAVKYSYRTAASAKHGDSMHRRFVSVRGQFWQNGGENGYRISISNYGVGIEPNELDKIFTEGYKGKLTKAEYRTGSGQGLSLTKRIIEKHNGIIVAHSEPVGETVEDGTRPYHTRFVIWLPLKQPAE